MGWIGSAVSLVAPRILIFSIAMGADYSFYVKTIETHVHALLTLNILAIDRVLCKEKMTWLLEFLGTIFKKKNICMNSHKTLKRRLLTQEFWAWVKSSSLFSFFQNFL